MISRRNIRVKVMQVIYALEAMDDVKAKNNPVQALSKKLEESRELFVYLLHFITQVAQYAEIDAKHRASKHITTKEDLNVNTKIAGNEQLWKILESASYRKAIEVTVPKSIDSQDWIKKIYQRLVDTDIYQEYIKVENRDDKQQEKEILRYIFTDLMLPDEDFLSFVEEHFTNWDDDAEMMNQLMPAYLQKPAAYDLYDMTGTEKWQFARDLLNTTMEKTEHLSDLIKPKLKNWDADRIAQLDMILMQMGVAEFLYFDTIPPKVTINEYIDIAKEYSTPQSGQFVNGILDGIHKELVATEKMHKTDFKK
ncbi:NusB antitermination factor [Filimonas lacunae]|uniref:NusB antitermination factor n=1 Tax=Filimonas lacunae TaxID=477680 RepID=A0A173MJK4_9BACT|nr:transcription antitermination factor NusB [Filimonas lacunae]BAV07659.1 transcription termination protein NusB [Filimonas lacunae]SIT03136.1 NusB antitermination factor [Filimonas lacunae]